MSHYKDADLDFAFGGSTAPPEQSSPQRSVPDIKRLHQRKNLHKADVSQTDSSLPECLHRDPDGEGITSLTETSNVRSAGSAVPISLTVEEEAAIQTFSASFVQPPLATGQQKDAENDARTQVPYRINRETFKVPLVCPDDLVAGTDKMWCPGKPLRIAYVTWNMAGKKPRAGEVSSFCIHPNAHIVVVGTQENGGYLIGNRKQKKWLKEITTNCLKNNYKLVKATHMWALHLAVFARDRDVAAYVSHAHTADVSTGTCGWGGNKGGVAVALSLSMLRPDNSLVATPMKANRDYFSTSLERDTTIKKVSPAKQAKTDGNESGGAQIKEGELERVPSAASAGCDKDSSRKASFGANTEEQMAEEAAEQNGTHEQSVYSSPEEVFVDEPLPTGRVEWTTPELTFLFVNSHLAAHQGAVKKRNKDYKKIVRRLQVGHHGKYRDAFKKLAAYDRHGVDEEDTLHHHVSSPPRVGHSDEDDSITELPDIVNRSRRVPIQPHRDATEEFDLTLFGGDLNYRIDGTKKAIEVIVQQHQNIRSVLINNDQLSLERAKGAVFHGFHEGALYFRPTYKYEVSKGVTLDQYNFSKKKDRMPAYCDRVLYKRRKGSFVKKVAIKLYTDVPNVRTSDHRPVVAIYEVETAAHCVNSLSAFYSSSM